MYEGHLSETFVHLLATSYSCEIMYQALLSLIPRLLSDFSSELCEIKSGCDLETRLESPHFHHTGSNKLKKICMCDAQPSKLAQRLTVSLSLPFLA